MTNQTIPLRSADFEQRFKNHRINRCTEFQSSPVDALNDLLPKVYALLLMVGEALGKEEDRCNPMIEEQAIDGIAHLVALADFHAGEL